MSDDKELDLFLSESYVPERDSSLTEDICNEATKTEFDVNQVTVNYQKLALAFSVLLFAGFALGFFEDSLLGISSSNVNLSEFLYSDEGTIL